jgi:hypothetical protein
MPWLLLLIWVLLGLVAGALANAARWGLGAHGLGGQHAVWATIGLGVAAALVGGVVGWFAFGRFFATPAALWVAALAVGAGPWLTVQIRQRVSAARERR